MHESISAIIDDFFKIRSSVAKERTTERTPIKGEHVVRVAAESNRIESNRIIESINHQSIQAMTLKNLVEHMSAR